MHHENRAADYFPTDKHSSKAVMMERPGMDGGKPPFAQHGVTEHRSYMTDIGDISKRNDRSNIAKTGSQIVG